MNTAVYATTFVFGFKFWGLLWALCLLPAGFLTYRRSIHMYQLCSYQNPSYKKYLKENTAESFSVKRLSFVSHSCTGGYSRIGYLYGSVYSFNSSCC